MSATRATPVSFPGEKAIKKRTLDKLLSKRSYVDSTSNVLVLLQGGKAPSSAVHVPEKYAKILHIISYRYEVYRHATAVIQVAKTCCDTRLAIQQLARVLQYLDDVRAAYFARARRSNIADQAWFCPELEYHTWLDYHERAYHNNARDSLEKSLGVTFEYILERKRPDISTFIDWDEYVQFHNSRFDMCGLGTTLGKDVSTLQASQDFAKAILEDLEAAVKQKKGKEKAVAVGNTACEAKDKRITRSSSATTGKAQTSSRVNTLKPSKWRNRPESEQEKSMSDAQADTEGDEDQEDEIGDDRGMVAENDEDEMNLEAINAAENENCRSSNERQSRTGADVWNKRFVESYTFIRQRLLEIANTDINNVVDDHDLEAWHRSIDLTDPFASEILGYIILLRSNASLENGTNQHLRETVESVGERNKQAMARRAEEKARKRQQVAQQNDQDDPGRLNRDPEGQTDVVGTIDLDFNEAMQMNGADEMTSDQGMQEFLKMIARDTGMAQGLESVSIVDVSMGGNDGEDCIPVEAALKRRRASSTGSLSSEEMISKKTKQDATSTNNPLASIAMEGIFDFLQE